MAYFQWLGVLKKISPDFLKKPLVIRVYVHKDVFSYEG